MKYAFNIPNFGPYADAAAVADLARSAEQSGWDGFVVWDHIVIGDGMPVGDPWVILTAVAMKTERILIGPMVTPLPRRRPWVVARQTVTLDHLSGGRLVLGVLVGHRPVRFAYDSGNGAAALVASRVFEALGQSPCALFPDECAAHLDSDEGFFSIGYFSGRPSDPSHFERQSPIATRKQMTA